ncbi:MAG TPA: hypothetical protein VJ783_08115 [Pirellulales bacterium]|nr:hypothetical protein [Pirellulales bacterium]
MISRQPDTNGDSISLTEEISQARKLLGEEIGEFAEERLREDLLLQRGYAGQYVAFADRWKTQAGKRKLVRTVIAAASTPWELERRLSEIPGVDRKSLSRVFLDAVVQPTERRKPRE